MKPQTLIIILLVALCAAMYLLGKRNGTTELKSTVINNLQFVQQIAELSVLEVSGTTTVKLSNTGDKTGWWQGVKNYLVENTLQVSVPYHAKYGVDVSKGKISISQDDTSVVLHFPAVAMLSFQVELDKLETMNQTGLFNRTTIADMKLAQQQLYTSSKQQLASNAAYVQKSEEQIKSVFKKYYQPLGYNVICTFDNH
jgi:hypothetical protein